MPLKILDVSVCPFGALAIKWTLVAIELDKNVLG